MNFSYNKKKYNSFQEKIENLSSHRTFIKLFQNVIISLIQKI